MIMNIIGGEVIIPILYHLSNDFFEKKMKRGFEIIFDSFK